MWLKRAEDDNTSGSDMWEYMELHIAKTIAKISGWNASGDQLRQQLSLAKAKRANGVMPMKVKHSKRRGSRLS